jgi:hypothetical protein
MTAPDRGAECHFTLASREPSTHELRSKLGVSDQRIKPDQHHGERQGDEGGTPRRRLHISSHRRKLREVPARAQIGMLIIEV